HVAVPNPAKLQSLGAELQELLEANPYYRCACELRQLRPVEVAVLDPRGERASESFAKAMTQRGVRLGNIKPTTLDASPEWDRRFASLTLFVVPAAERERNARQTEPISAPHQRPPSSVGGSRV